MKIAYLVNTYPYVSLTFVRREIHALEQRGHTVKRLALRPPDVDMVDALDQRELELTHHILSQSKAGLLGAAARELATNPGGFLRALGAAIQMGRRGLKGVLHHCIYLVEACAAKQWLKAEGVEHLHVHFGTNPTAVARLVAKLGGLQYSFTIHGPEEWDDQASLSLEEKMADAAAVVGISHYTIAQMRRRVPVEEWGKLHRIHCTIEAEGFENPKPVQADSKLLVCTARLVPQKGQMTLLEAARVLHERGVDFQLALLGGGDLEELLKDTVTRYGLEDHVQLHGWVNGQDVRDNLEKARSLVLPSYAEGLPVAIMESLAMKRPVISTYVAGIPELVRDQENGWLVPPGDVDALADAMQGALEASPDTLDTMGSAGRQRTLASHTAATEAVKLENVFAEIIRRNPRHQPQDAEPSTLRPLASGRAES